MCASSHLSKPDYLLMRFIGQRVSPDDVSAWDSLGIDAQTKLLQLFADAAMHHMTNGFIDWWACCHLQFRPSDGYYSIREKPRLQWKDPAPDPDDSDFCLCKASHVEQVCKVGESTIFETSDQPFLLYDLEAANDVQELNTWLHKNDFPSVMRWKSRDILELMLEKAAVDDGEPDTRPSIDEVFGQFKTFKLTQTAIETAGSAFRLPDYALEEVEDSGDGHLLVFSSAYEKRWHEAEELENQWRRCSPPLHQKMKKLREELENQWRRCSPPLHQKMKKLSLTDSEPTVPENGQAQSHWS